VGSKGKNREVLRAATYRHGGGKSPPPPPPPKPNQKNTTGVAGTKIKSLACRTLGWRIDQRMSRTVGETTDLEMGRESKRNISLK